MCVFCKIIEGSIPSTTVYEDERVKCILDLSQAGVGHTLVIPKAHYANVLEIDDETFGYAMKIAKKIAKALKKTFNCDGINILNNCGEAAGQTVFHLHIHVIPRFFNDTVDVKWVDHSDKFDPQNFEDIKNEIVKNLQ
ncbi:MAG: HIT family protein [Acholeplasmatales bacterium]|nr:HIT family protein [Acholeplasmatales bacterium]